MEPNSSTFSFDLVDYLLSGPEGQQATPVTDTGSNIDFSEQLTNIESSQNPQIPIGERAITASLTVPESMVAPATWVTHSTIDDQPPDSMTIPKGGSTPLLPVMSDLGVRPGPSSAEDSKRDQYPGQASETLLVNPKKETEKEFIENPPANSAAADMSDGKPVVEGKTQTSGESNSNKKPYKCEECGKSYVSQGSLSRHKRNHTGIRDYICEYREDAHKEICGKSFNRADRLKNHQLTHGEKNLVCPVCSKAFTQPNGLRQHMMRTHISK